jgi:hypothetical protein
MVMRVIYIAGMSHSGSTLLSLMLNAHPEIISVGELIDLSRRLQPRKDGSYAPCPCGAPSLWKCDFWSRVSSVVQEKEGKSLAELDVRNYSERDQSRAANFSIFRAISEVVGKRFVVDSSKRPDSPAQRLAIELGTSWTASPH